MMNGDGILADLPRNNVDKNRVVFYAATEPMRKLAICLIVLIVCGLFAFSQQPQRSEALRQIIPGHYVFTSSTYNSGVIVTGEGVILLDALNSEDVGRAERKAIEDAIRQPVRVLVSSSFHNNYSKGNQAYADVWKIAHENYRTDLLDLMQREKCRPRSRKRDFRIRPIGIGSRFISVEKRFRSSMWAGLTREATASYTFRRTALSI
jgi:hypothetical protein